MSTTAENTVLESTVLENTVLPVRLAAAPRPGHPVRRPRPGSARWVQMVTGGLERLWVGTHSLGTLTSDGSVIGLMALDLIHHGQLPAYFWGQSYGGSIEAVLTAVVFTVAGVGKAQLLATTALDGLQIYPLHGIVLVDGGIGKSDRSCCFIDKGILRKILLQTAIPDLRR